MVMVSGITVDRGKMKLDPILVSVGGTLQGAWVRLGCQGEPHDQIIALQGETRRWSMLCPSVFWLTT